jgi:hypothetical protein
VSNGAVSLSHMRLDLDVAQILQHRHRANTVLTTQTVSPQGVATQTQNRVIDWDEGAESQIDDDGDLVMREVAPGIDPAVVRENGMTGDGRRDNDGKAIRRVPHLQAHQMIGTPNLRYWMMMTRGGARERSTGETPGRSTSGSSSGQSASGSGRWWATTYNMQRPIKGSRILSP